MYIFSKIKWRIIDFFKYKKLKQERPKPSNYAKKYQKSLDKMYNCNSLTQSVFGDTRTVEIKNIKIIPLNEYEIGGKE